MTHRAPALTMPQAVPHQLQYLEAMGITAWTARYRLPHAAETVACDWPQRVPDPAAAQPPVQRLQLFLDQPPIDQPPIDQPSTAAASIASDTAAVSLSLSSRLSNRPAHGDFKASIVGREDSSTHQAAAQSPPPASAPKGPSAAIDNTRAETAAETRAASGEQEAAALRFKLQVASLDSRWLVVLVQPDAPNALERRLLASLLASVGIVPSGRATFIDFQWPMMEGLAVESPVIEAQQGIKAFLDGRAREGLSPEQLVLFGEDDKPAMVAFQQALALEGLQSSLLSLPVWRAPSLSTLLNSAEAKRALWPALYGLGQRWQAPQSARQAQGADL